MVIDSCCKHDDHNSVNIAENRHVFVTLVSLEWYTTRLVSDIAIFVLKR